MQLLYNCIRKPTDPRAAQFADASNGKYTGIVEHGYDVRNNLTKLALNFGGRSVSASYTNEKLLDSAGNVTGYTGDYEKGNLPTRFTMYPDRVVNYEYDRLDRLTMRYFVNSGVPVYNSYQYYVRQNAPSESNVVYRTTQLIREIVDNTGYTYTYDDVGNILTVKTSQRLYPNTSKVEIGEHSDYRSYSYDNKYQLTRENNVTSGKTTVYSYDGLGNITSKTEYPYTQGALGTALSTVNYTYSNDGKNGWNKLLTAVGDETVTYDAIGNPTSYLGASLSWFGRKLQSYEKGNTNVTYTYDAGGSRASKTVNGTKSEFVYLDGKLVYEKRGGDDIFYLYDSYGSLSNIRWYKNGASSPTNIYVITNRQGDVLGLYDYAGTRKVSYEYDAWGNTVSVTDTSEDCWSTLNPFRYRGYYFDTETGLYYLLSRYYDPAVGRFLNADGFVSTGQGVLGYNMFAYCLNNPVNMSDENGNWPKWLSGALNAVGGALQIAAGVALGATVGWTGFGAVVAGFLIVNGAATVVQGMGQIVNDITKTNVLREDNIVRTAVKDVGRGIGGDTGASVAGGVYDAAVVASNLYAGKIGIEKSMPKIIDSKIFSVNNGYGFKIGKYIEMFYRNPNAAGGPGGTFFSYKGPLGKFRIDWDPAHGFHCHPPGH